MDLSQPPSLTPEQLALLPHDDAGQHLVASIWTLISVASVFLSLRVYCKLLRRSNFWWDDYVLIAAWLCSLTECIVLTVCVVKTGYGKHSWDIFMQYSPDQMNLGFRLLAVAGTFSITAAVWSKTSFAITLLRLTDKKTKMFIWFIIISMNIAMGLSALLPWVSCTPLKKGWDMFTPGTCWEGSILTNYNIFSAAYSAAMDFTLTLLPWKLIWGLNMKKKEKIGVAVAMSCGVFAGITAIVKTVKIKTGMSETDFAAGVDLYIWGNAETASSIVGACIPILRMLFREVRTAARHYYASKNGDTSRGGTSRSIGGGRSNTNTVSITAKRSRTQHSVQNMDDWSQKSILDDSSTQSPKQSHSHGRIVQTNEVAVEYQDVQGGNIVEYKMENLHSRLPQ